MNISLITGITGQDGSYLTELLLEKNYEVWGIIRRSSTDNTQRINHINNNNLYLRFGDITDKNSLLNIYNEIIDKYDNILKLEIYNLAAMSDVKISFNMPEYCIDVNGKGTLYLLEIIKNSKIKDKIRFYQASTSELYGLVNEIPQTENTVFYPRSPYGVSKLYSYWIVKNYRETYNIHASNGILFNHESPRRGCNFVTRKITMGLNKILKGEIEYIELGNLNAKRDWGHAKDYVYGMWLILQSDKSDDYVLSSNESYSIRDFVEISFRLKGINIKWKGEGFNEIGYSEETNKVLIKVSEKYYRPCEVEQLLGDSTKAKNKLNWKTNMPFKDLIKEMVEHDCK
jgi:GDPmannose 4,6-dehydratase